MDIWDTYKSKTNETQITKLHSNAIGCTSCCFFCNRKCEMQPHGDTQLKHNCNTMGH